MRLFHGPPPMVLMQHRTIASARFGGSFPPILRLETFEIHTVFPHLSSLALTKNLSPNLLAELRGAALVSISTYARRRVHVCADGKCFAQKGKAPVTDAFPLIFQMPSSWRFFAANSSSVSTPASSSALYCLSSSTVLDAPPACAGAAVCAAEAAPVSGAPGAIN